MGDDNAEVIDGSLVKRAFLGLEVEVVFGKAGENFVGKFMEVGEVVVEHEDVIQVDYEVFLVDKVIEDRVHEGLKGCWGVAEAESHDEGFKESKGAFEGSFPFVALADTDVIVTPADVELGKIAGALEFVNEVRDEW